MLRTGVLLRMSMSPFWESTSDVVVDKIGVAAVIEAGETRSRALCVTCVAVRHRHECHRALSRVG